MKPKRIKKRVTRARQFVMWFKHIRLTDVPLVGGKNAALGEMVSNLGRLGINVPDGFAITAAAYRYFLENSGLKTKIHELLNDLDTKNIRALQQRGKAVRQLILNATLPEEIVTVISDAYARLAKVYGHNPDVAVRSSATAEDLPGASFAGQQETYLNIVGIERVLVAVKKCMASLFTDRAISYRADKGFSHFRIALSVAVQKMVRSDLGSSGVMFTIDTETGFDKVVVINGVYGLGEMIVQGKVTPDEFLVFKPGLKAGYRSIISRTLGKKNAKLVYGGKTGTRTASVAASEQCQFCLNDKEILELSRWGVRLEEYFSRKHGYYQPMDIEWAKDGKTGKLFIVQARPETVHSVADKRVYEEYRLKTQGRLLLTGTAVGTKIASGKVKIIKNPREIAKFRPGEILVSEITDPDWEPLMKIASAIITDKGGRTSHAAIVSRELGISCIVGTKTGTRVLRDGMQVTVDCSSGDVGRIYAGKQKFVLIEHNLAKIPRTRTKIMVNIGSPEDAFKNHYLPVSGVGLGRLEFVIASQIKIHPNALLEYETLKKTGRTPGIRNIVNQIEKISWAYDDKREFYVRELASGIAKIAAAFWPHDVIIRFSDFKTNEYRTLVGGERYEPHEENPMLGWRGASRYYDEKFQEAFGLECRAIQLVRQELGLSNVVPMVPFCRTPEEGRQVVTVMAKNGLSKKLDHRLRVYVMCEIPSNILLAHEFLDIFDGMSIGSNDLTQLTLGLDRDSGIVTKIANENNEAVKKLIAEVIGKCRRRKKYIGICGQAPSDFPEFVAFLLQHKIDSMSLNPDSVIKIVSQVAKYEKRF